MFRTIIPLNDAATLKSGPKVSDQASDQDRKWEIGIYNTRKTNEPFAEIYKRRIEERSPLANAGENL